MSYNPYNNLCPLMKITYPFFLTIYLSQDAKHEIFLLRLQHNEATSNTVKYTTLCYVYNLHMYKAYIKSQHKHVSTFVFSEIATQ